MRKGQIMTEEQKRKISKAHEGKKLSEEHKRKISENCKGRICTEEARMNYIKANGIRMENKEYKEKWIRIIQSGEVRKKRNKALTGLKRSSNICQKMSRLAKKQWQEKRNEMIIALNHPETKAKMRKSALRLRADPNSIFNSGEYKDKLKASWNKERKMITSKRMKKQWENPNSIFNSPEFRKNLKDAKNSLEAITKTSEISKRMWQNPKFIKKWMVGQAKGQHISPNNLEQYFDKLTPKCIKFVGNRKYWIITNIGIHNPDFKIIGQRKIIELFGDYWHKKKIPEELIKEYAEVGWKCLIFWENEVYNRNREVLKRTIEFIKEGTKIYNLGRGDLR